MTIDLPQWSASGGTTWHQQLALAASPIARLGLPDQQIPGLFRTHVTSRL